MCVEYHSIVLEGTEEKISVIISILTELKKRLEFNAIVISEKEIQLIGSDEVINLAINHIGYVLYGDYNEG